MNQYERNRRIAAAKDRQRYDASASTPRPGQHDRVRVGRMFSRATYPGWTYSVANRYPGLSLLAFRAHPETGLIQRLGPWDLPADAGFDEVRDAALAAAIEVDGEAARGRFTWSPESADRL